MTLSRHAPVNHFQPIHNHNSNYDTFKQQTPCQTKLKTRLQGESPSANGSQSKRKRYPLTSTTSPRGRSSKQKTTRKKSRQQTSSLSMPSCIKAAAARTEEPPARHTFYLMVINMMAWPPKLRNAERTCLDLEAGEPLLGPSLTGSPCMSSCLRCRPWRFDPSFPKPALQLAPPSLFCTHSSVWAASFPDAEQQQPELHDSKAPHASDMSVRARGGTRF
ncbi:uncharacterized protein B0I36DRAFT_311084 [Microdochium trichocladiopsis]|uniref:Uncharacterized protein n=1 Tax=Microdochium trichocladiopsis TaxID=1682393 RepID=A0A9P8YHQ7_9PEZI|nr:uncharacterized protein B0I36DRAFT_311084 [Microdochium trichocladiopsis]KAH7040609.1 hypothetical protein B0I36DRAFT_311084 [Microdochium trichocladiopsis]